VHSSTAAALATARPGAECGAVDAGGAKGDRRLRLRPRLQILRGTAWATAWAWMATSGLIWFAGNTTKLAANMTTSNEPGIYIRGEFGIRLEDDMHVTESGAELFTPQSPSLEDPFGNPCRVSESRNRRRTRTRSLRRHHLQIVG